jgi:hypothetical protein
MSYAGWQEDSVFVEYNIGYWDPDILKVKTASEAKGFDYLMTLSLSRRMVSLATPIRKPQNLHSTTILWVCTKQMLYFRVLKLYRTMYAQTVLLSEGTLWTSCTKVGSSISIKHTFHCSSLLISLAHIYTTQDYTWSPFVLRLPWLADCGMWNFLQDTGAVHRITHRHHYLFIN